MIPLPASIQSALAKQSMSFFLGMVLGMGFASGLLKIDPDALVQPAGCPCIAAGCECGCLAGGLCSCDHAEGYEGCWCRPCCQGECDQDCACPDGCNCGCKGVASSVGVEDLGDAITTLDPL